MENEASLTVVRQQSITFYDDQIVAVQVEDETVYVPIRPICDLLGIDRRAQQRRIERDPVLAEVCQLVTVNMGGAVTTPHTDMSGAVTTPHTPSSSRQRLTQEMLSIPLDYLNGWLFGISTLRVKEAVRPALIRYQKECFKVLAQAFLHNEVTHRPDSILDELLENSENPSAVAYRHAMAIANIAREQLVIQLRVDSAETKLTDHDNRLNLIEAQLGNPDRFITVPQSEQLSQAVRAVGIIFSKSTGRNEYGSVYGELYRRFSVNSYKRLPAAKFDEAMNWLRQWYEDLSDGDDAPF